MYSLGKILWMQKETHKDNKSLKDNNVNIFNEALTSLSLQEYTSLSLICCHCLLPSLFQTQWLPFWSVNVSNSSRLWGICTFFPSNSKAASWKAWLFLVPQASANCHFGEFSPVLPARVLAPALPSRPALFSPRHLTLPGLFSLSLFLSPCLLSVPFTGIWGSWGKRPCHFVHCHIPGA